MMQLVGMLFLYLTRPGSGFDPFGKFQRVVLDPPVGSIGLYYIHIS